MPRVISNRNVNLHSKSIQGGLIHAPARRAVEVPEDVTEHPGFQTMIDAGDLVILQSGTAPKSRRARSLVGENPGGLVPGPYPGHDTSAPASGSAANDFNLTQEEREAVEQMRQKKLDLQNEEDEDEHEAEESNSRTDEDEEEEDEESEGETAK